MTAVDRNPAGVADFIVLMATRNGQPWISQQLESVLAQEGVRVRVLVSDDASVDGTVPLLRRAASEDDRIVLLPSEKPSGSACANFLRLIRSVDADQSRGCTHVAFCDQDDIWHSDKLQRAALSLVRNDADLYSSAVTARWPSGKCKDLVQCASATEADHFFEGAGQGCTFVLSKTLFDRVRTVAVQAPELLLSIHYHDWMIYALSRTWNKRWFYDAVPTMVYRQHDSNDTGARASLNGIRMRGARIRSGWYAQQVRAVLALCRNVDPEQRTGALVESLMDASGASPWKRLRWCRFLLTRSRRRFSDRFVLFFFAGLGAL